MSFFNEGVAFAYEFPEQKGLDSLIITDEKIVFRFPSDHLAWSASRAQAQYSQVPLSKIETGCERPLVIEIDRREIDSNKVYPAALKANNGIAMHIVPVN